MIPIGMPGMGKSFLSKFLEKNSKKLKFDRFIAISIDRIRSEVQKKNPGKALDYLRSVQETSHRFYSELTETLQQLQEQKPEKTLLYLDKNHTPTILDTTFEHLYKASQGMKLRTVALIPALIGKPITLKGHQYPFSWELVLACLSRCLNRENHETLDQEDPVDRIKIVLKFVQIFRDVKVKGLEGFERVVEVPFVKENGVGVDSRLDSLMELVKKALETIPPKGEAKDSPIFCEIAEEFYRIGGKLVQEDGEAEFEEKAMSAFAEI